MIKIPIDSNNINLRDKHYSNIKTELENSLTTKRNLYISTTIEYQFFQWLITNLEDILTENITNLRRLINNYNTLLSTFLVRTGFITKKLTIKNICKILDENNILYLKNRKKEYYRKLFIQNRRQHNIISFNYILKLQYNKYFYNDLEEIFIKFYEKQWDKINSYTRYDFVREHNLNTCPYCNRNYIFLVDKKNNRLRPEIDHFFPKSLYPFLAMSFYNLIPSCQICNHTKKDKDAYEDNLISPYEINFQDFKFKYKPKNINFYQIKKKKYNEKRFEITLNKLNGVSINDEYFKLELLYNQHKDIVLDLLVKKVIYNKTYIKELKDNFKFTDDEIYRFLVCNYLKETDFHKRPLSKLIKDISEDIGLII